MLTVTILCVGKLKERYLTDACAEYIKRLKAFCRIVIEECPESPLPDRPSEAEIARCLEKEGDALLKKLPKDAAVIPLCIEGKELSSPALAKQIEQLAVSGKSELAFIIGGSYGLSERVKAAGTLRLSMSPMTFPHQLARVMLLEQIYRSFQILQNGKYHK